MPLPCCTALLFVSLLAAAVADEDAGDAKPETASAEIALETKNRREDRILYFRGEQIFDRQCVQCHGSTGRGNGPWSEEMTNKPRNLRSGIFKFRTTPYGKLPSDDDLRRTIRSGIFGTAMPAFSKMSDAEMDGIVVFVQNLSRRWRDEALYSKPIVMPGPPDWIGDKAESTVQIKAGRTLFAKMCASCHGEEGKGDGLASKGLVDAWEHPIVPADLTQKHHKSGDAPEDLYRTIATGLDGTPMVGFHGTLEPQQIWELVAFIRSLVSDGTKSKAE